MRVTNAAEALAWMKLHPSRDGGSWNGWSPSLLVRMLGVPLFSSAAAALAETTIDGTDPHDAPPMAYHWFEGTPEGWNMLDLDGGGTRVLVTGNIILATPVGIGVGTCSIDTIIHTSQSRYVGWSVGYGDLIST